MDEQDSMPLSLCPVCLRKLSKAIGSMAKFDAVERERRLASFFAKVGMEEEEQWYGERYRTVSSQSDWLAKNKENQSNKSPMRTRNEATTLVETYTQ
jgi:hypothetical protein